MVKSEKLRKLESVARLYYEQGKNQAEIAGILGVSRPLVSRMLDEARKHGVVEIRIIPQERDNKSLLEKAKAVYGLQGGVWVGELGDDSEMNGRIGGAALSLIDELGGGHLGIGWGHVIGSMVSVLENNPSQKSSVTDVCPMVGNSHVAIRHYHSNENTRIVAQQTMSQGHYLYTPALAETRQELELLLQTEQYRAILREWNKLDIALVNIGNHPSSPDFATGARFGNLLVKQRAVGRIIAYYYDENGRIIHSNHDYIIQIPLDILTERKAVIGICSAFINHKALKGALATRLLTHIVAREAVMEQVLAEA